MIVEYYVNINGKMEKVQGKVIRKAKPEDFLKNPLFTGVDYYLVVSCFGDAPFSGFWPVHDCGVISE